MAKPIDVGSGQLVVLLHGIGRNGQTWQYLSEALADQPVRIVAFDLLGFGESPKPDWLDYTVDDHVAAVVHSIKRLQPVGPCIIVGHSMGCLIAVRLAAKRPDLVKNLLLYQMPLLKGLPNKRSYRLRLNVYQRLYERILQYQPEAIHSRPKLRERFVHRYISKGIDADSWQAYVNSLTNTVYEQTAPEDIPRVTAPMDVIYGSLDLLVIRGTIKHIHHRSHSEKLPVVHTILASHRITKRASRFLAERIMSATSDI